MINIFKDDLIALYMTVKLISLIRYFHLGEYILETITI